MSLLSECSDNDFIILVKESFSIAECETKLGYNSYSGSVAQLIKKRIENLQIDTSHFTSQNKHNWSEEVIFEINSGVDQKTLRRYFKDLNCVEYCCAICGQLPIWNNKPLTLILDHINGNNKDQRLENLRWVCPNCNQQLDTTGSKNQAYKKEIIKEEKYCVDCGVVITKNSERCSQCSQLKNASDIKYLNRDELKDLIRNKSFVEIGKMFNISDNAVRKWCDKHHLPRKSSEIKNYSDELWSKI